ncbi:MAG: histidine triad nucleotide-binding protein [Christensenellales bacterium]|jgi:histidine triad (HIT) family protein
MNDCLFCRIVAGDIPSNKVYEDDTVLAFYDIDKKAPVHVLIIPKKHIKSVAETAEEDMNIFSHIMRVAKKLAADFGLKNGFRLVTNIGREGGQTVDHLHFHLLGGRIFLWPPG